MKLFVAGFFMFLLIVGTAQAMDIEEYGVVFDILPSLQVHETVTIVFAEAAAEPSENFLTLGDVSSVEVKADDLSLEVDVSQQGDDVEVRFTIPEGTIILEISFQAKNLVFSSGGVEQFFVSFNPPSQAETIQVKAILPKGFVVFRDTYFPSDAVKGTDGERIFFEWEIENAGEIPISIQFESVFKVNELLIPGIVSAAVIVIVIVFFFFRRKSKQAFLMTFFEDERKVILTLREEKVAYQNTLERKFGFSRAKVTRIVQKLERKGLVKKEKAGRTNRLHWKG